MPHVAITMIPGRDDETKSALAQKVQALLVSELGIEPKYLFKIFRWKTGRNLWNNSRMTSCMLSPVYNS